MIYRRCGARNTTRYTMYSSNGTAADRTLDVANGTVPYCVQLARCSVPSHQTMYTTTYVLQKHACNSGGYACSQPAAVSSFSDVHLSSA